MIPLTTKDLRSVAGRQEVFYLYDQLFVQPEAHRGTPVSLYISETSYTEVAIGGLISFFRKDLTGVAFGVLSAVIWRYYSTLSSENPATLRLVKIDSDLGRGFGSGHGFMIALENRSVLIKFEKQGNAFIFTYHYVYQDRGILNLMETAIYILETARPDIESVIEKLCDQDIEVKEALLPYVECSIRKLAKRKNIDEEGKNVCDIITLVHKDYIPDETEVDIFTQSKLNTIPALYLFEHDNKYFDIVGLAQWGITKFRSGQSISNPLTQREIRAVDVIDELLDRALIINNCRTRLDEQMFEDVVEAINDENE
jgi:hypothetical protein